MKNPAIGYPIPMTGLILDTSSKMALLGLASSGKLEKFETLPGAKNLSSTLFPKLAASFVDLDTLSYIAIGVGPGSYMGVRTGATIAKTLAFARNLPLIEFSSILTFLPHDLEGEFTYCGDAKMQEFFLVTGKAREGRILSLSAPTLTKNRPEEALSPVDPHLEWAVKMSHEAFLQGNILDPESLSLSYLR